MSSSDAFPFDGSADAAQLGERAFDASRLGESSLPQPSSLIRIGSFNIGVDQDMLTSRNYKTVLQKVEHVITVCVQDSALDIMCLCALGGHKQGFDECRPPIRPEDMKIFQTSPPPSVSVNNNYLAAWGFIAGTSQFGVEKVTDCCRTIYLNSGICEPEMVVHKLQNRDGVTLVLANLHIRIPSGALVTRKTKQRVILEAMTLLDGFPTHDSAAQPVVRVLVGDCNLTKDHAEEAVQPLQTTAPPLANGLASACNFLWTGRRFDFRERRQCHELRLTLRPEPQRPWR